MAAGRALVFTLVVTMAVVLQVALFPYLSVRGVVPNLALLVVVAAALARGPEFAAVIGFLAGLAIDLAPPSDHVAGRWALALVVVGYLAGRVRQDARTSTVAAVVTVAACSFVGTSVFALSGMVLGASGVPATALVLIPAVVLYDVALTPFALPAMVRLFQRLEPHEAH